MVEIGARQGANRSEVGYLARICNAAWRRFSAIFNNELLTHHIKSALAAVLAVAGAAKILKREVDAKAHADLLAAIRQQL